MDRQKLKEFGTENFLGAHCTGVEAVYRIRQLVGWTEELRRRVGWRRVHFGAGLAPGTISNSSFNVRALAHSWTDPQNLAASSMAAFQSSCF